MMEETNAAETPEPIRLRLIKEVLGEFIMQNEFEPLEVESLERRLNALLGELLAFRAQAFLEATPEMIDRGELGGRVEFPSGEGTSLLSFRFSQS